jgi:hypothetical protein
MRAYQRSILGGLVLAVASGCVAQTGAAGQTAGADTDDSSSVSKTPATLVASAPFLTAMLADGASLYWADNSGNLWSVPLAGGDSTPLASTNVSDQFPSLALDANNLYVSNGTLIASVPIAGGTLTTLATAAGPTSALVLGGGSLYWATGFTNPAVANSAAINQVSTQGGNMATVAANLDAPAYLAVDDVNVYWADIAAGTISAMPLAGGNVTTLVSNQGGINGFSLQGSRIYWSNFSGPSGEVVGQPAPVAKMGDGTINWVSTDGSDTKVLAKAYTVSTITVDGSYVYWSDGQANTISRTRVSGGDSEVLAHDSISAGPVVQGDTLYYGVLLGPPANTFTIRSITK